MTEIETIDYCDCLNSIDKLRVYMKYFCNMLHWKHTDNLYFRVGTRSFNDFCNPSNVIKHEVGEHWRERGFASKEWVNFNPCSIYHYVYHNIK